MYTLLFHFCFDKIVCSQDFIKYRILVTCCTVWKESLSFYKSVDDLKLLNKSPDKLLKLKLTVSRGGLQHCGDVLRPLWLLIAEFEAE